MGWVVGFEPTTFGTTIRRSTKLSYTHREGRRSYSNSRSRAAANRVTGASRHRRHVHPKPARCHNSSTRRFTSGVISITPGQGRVKPSPGHFRVASIPIFDP